MAARGRKPTYKSPAAKQAAYRTRLADGPVAQLSNKNEPLSGPAFCYCGKPTRFNAADVPRGVAYHYACAEEIGIDHGPVWGGTR